MRCFYVISILIFCLIGISDCTTTKKASEEPEVTTSKYFNPNEFDVIAILVKDNTDNYYRGEGGIIRKVENLFSQAALRKGYHLASRSETKEIEKEINFESDNLGGLTAPDITRPGHLYNISALWIVNINKSDVERRENVAREIFQKAIDKFTDIEEREDYYSVASISTSLISIREGEVLWTSSYTGSVKIPDKYSRKSAIPKVSKSIANTLPCHSCR